MRDNNGSNTGPGDLHARRRRQRSGHKKIDNIQISTTSKRYVGKTAATAVGKPEESKDREVLSSSRISSDHSVESWEFQIIPTPTPGSALLLPISPLRIQKAKGPQKPKITQPTILPQSATAVGFTGNEQDMSDSPSRSVKPPPRHSLKWGGVKRAVRKGLSSCTTPGLSAVKDFFESREIKKQEKRRTALKKLISAPKGKVDLDETREFMDLRQQSQAEAKQKSDEIIRKTSKRGRSASNRLTRMTDFLRTSEASSPKRSPMRNKALNASGMSFACKGLDPEPVQEPTMCGICRQAPASTYSGLCGACAKKQEEQPMKDLHANIVRLLTDPSPMMKIDASREEHIDQTLRALEGKASTADADSHTHPVSKQTPSENDDTYTLPRTTYIPPESAKKRVEETHIPSRQTRFSEAIEGAQETYRPYKRTFNPPETEEETRESETEENQIRKKPYKLPDPIYPFPLSALPPPPPPPPPKRRMAKDRQRKGTEKHDRPLPRRAPESKIERERRRRRERHVEQPAPPPAPTRPNFFFPATTTTISTTSSASSNCSTYTLTGLDSPMIIDTDLSAINGPPAPPVNPRRRYPSPPITIDLSTLAPPPNINGPRSPPPTTSPGTVYDPAALDAAISAVEEEGEKARRALPTYRIRTMSFERRFWEEEEAGRQRREEIRRTARRIPTMEFEREKFLRGESSEVSDDGLLGLNGDENDNKDDKDEDACSGDLIVTYLRR